MNFIKTLFKKKHDLLIERYTDKIENNNIYYKIEKNYIGFKVTLSDDEYFKITKNGNIQFTHLKAGGCLPLKTSKKVVIKLYNLISNINNR